MPITISRQRYRSPFLLILPNHSSLPLDLFNGVSPNQAANSRPVLERLSFTEVGHNGRGHDGADTWHCPDPFGALVNPGVTLNQLVIEGHSVIENNNLFKECSSMLFATSGMTKLSFAWDVSNHMAKFTKNTADHAHHLGLLVDDKLTHPVDGQLCLLCLRFYSDKSHRGSRDALANRLCIKSIGLAAFDIRLDVGCKHESHIMTNCGQLTRPVMANPHASIPTRQLLEELE